MLPRSTHRFFFLSFAALVAFSLPLSNLGVSIGIIGLVVNWLLEGGYRFRRVTSKSALPLFVFVGIYGVALLGLIFTTDFSWAFHDLRIKLPLLLLPLVFFFSDRISDKELRVVLLALVGGVLVGSVASMLALWGLIPVEINSSRSISLFISHIRFALLVCLAIAGLIYLFFRNFHTLSFWLRVVGIALTGWFYVYIFILQSETGMIILILLTFSFLVWKIIEIKNSMYRLWGFAFLVAAVLLLASFVTKTISFYYTVDVVDRNLDSYTTANGRPYSNDFSSTAVENGHFVDLLVCEEELAREWNRRGLLDYEAEGPNGYKVKYALKRFLTSKGLSKDSVGVWSLSNDEVVAISNGVANILDISPFSIKGKVYRLVREVDLYRKGYNAGGSSLAQRFVYWQIAKQIFLENWLTGVGTGDVKLAYQQKYAVNPTLIEPQFQLRAHNQYLTMFLTYGVFGGVLFIVALLYPLFAFRLWKEPLVLAFIAILLFSMLNEDTLETHIGVSFAAFFYSLLVFGWRRRLDDSTKNLPDEAR